MSRSFTFCNFVEFAVCLGVPVRSGDLVMADENGVCVVMTKAGYKP